MPGECRSKMGNAFASSVFVKRIACFMNVLQSRYSSRHQSTVKANEHQYTSREMPGALDALPPDVKVIWYYIAADEVRTVARELTRYGGDRVILVTSSYHTRRVKILWHALVGKYPEAVVRYTPDDPVQPRRWWNNSADVAAVSHEWLGFLQFWTGFPVKSEY